MITKADRLTTGVIDYFRNALAAIGRHSAMGNEKYKPADGTKELRWSFDVSTNHADAIASHLSQRGQIDPETGVSHTVALAWRALALLETELVAAGAKPGLAVVRSLEPTRFKVMWRNRPSCNFGLAGVTFATLQQAQDAIKLHGSDSCIENDEYTIVEVK